MQRGPQNYYEMRRLRRPIAKGCTGKHRTQGVQALACRCPDLEYYKKVEDGYVTFSGNE